jgi:hypothetical protein
MSNLAISGIPAWLDSWIFGVSYVGPVTAFTQLVQSYRQEVQVDTINGAFQVNAPSGMLINDYITLVDVGNDIASNNVTFSSAVSGYALQSPYTLIIGAPGAYAFGSHEGNGSRITWQLVQDPNLGAYLKYCPGVGIPSAGSHPVPGALITGLVNAIGVGDTLTVADCTSAVAAQISAGGSDGEIKEFVVGVGAAIWTVTSSAPLYVNGSLVTSFTLQGINATQVIRWIGHYPGGGAWVG